MSTEALSTKRTARMSNIELLRIISMFMIITFHSSYKSGFVFNVLTTNTFIIKAFWLFGELGVDLFMLISGYFLIKSTFKAKRFILLLLEVLFYYIFTYFLGVLAGTSSIPASKASFFILFFPTIMGQYWYATAYVLIYCLSPWINRALLAASKRNLAALICVMLVLWSIIPTLFGVFYDTTEASLYYSRFIWFFVMYCTGAYIRLYPPKHLESKAFSGLMALVSYALMCGAIVVIACNEELVGKFGLGEWAYFWTPNSFLMTLCSLGIFGLFLKLPIKPNRFINVVASTTLGIYLFHDGPLQNFLWPVLFNLSDAQNYALLPALMLYSAAVVFVVGVLVDLVRQLVERFTVAKLLDLPAIDRFGARIKTTAINLLDKLL